MDKDFFEELFNNPGKEQRNHREISKNKKKRIKRLTVRTNVEEVWRVPVRSLGAQNHNSLREAKL